MAAMASVTLVSLPAGGVFHPSISQTSKVYALYFRGLQHRRDVRLWASTCSDSVTAASPSPSVPSPPPSELYSAKVYDLNSKNVNLVLEDVRPYLIADGGNVDVVSVEDGVIFLKLQEIQDLMIYFTLVVFLMFYNKRFSYARTSKEEDQQQESSKHSNFWTGTIRVSNDTRGACGTCPSSTTTMKMGIERVLKEKFGNAVKDIRQVFDEEHGITTVEAVDCHLDILRPAIKNYGGSVEVLSINGGDCYVRYAGPEPIASGIKAAIKEKFPDIVNVMFTI